MHGQNRTWLPVLVIAGALAAWGIFLALGAYLAPAEEAGRDYRKLWVVAATVGGFLLLWGLVLVIHARKLRSRRGFARPSEHPGRAGQNRAEDEIPRQTSE